MIHGRRFTGRINSARRTGWRWWSEQRTHLSSLTASIRAAIHDVDPDQPLYDVRPMPAVLERTLRSQWINTVLIGIFAALALVLASVGLDGVVWDVTAQRRREFAIRLAVGAKASDVLALVLKQGFWLALVGLVPRLHALCSVDAGAGDHAAWCDCVGHLHGTWRRRA